MRIRQSPWGLEDHKSVPGRFWRWGIAAADVHFPPQKRPHPLPRNRRKGGGLIFIKKKNP